MAWLALDRGLRIADTHRLPGRQRQRWLDARDAIGVEVKQAGYNRSPRVRRTVDAMRERLSAGGSLLYRYPPGRDGLPGTEGAFLPCSFWLVQALACTGRREEALDVFEDLLAKANPLALWAEEMDPTTGGAYLGNCPQALSHAALVQAALAFPRSGSPRSGCGDVK